MFIARPPARSTLFPSRQRHHCARPAPPPDTRVRFGHALPCHIASRIGRSFDAPGCSPAAHSLASPARAPRCRGRRACAASAALATIAGSVFSLRSRSPPPASEWPPPPPPSESIPPPTSARLMSPLRMAPTRARAPRPLQSRPRDLPRVQLKFWTEATSRSLTHPPLTTSLGRNGTAGTTRRWPTVSFRRRWTSSRLCSSAARRPSRRWWRSSLSRTFWASPRPRRLRPSRPWRGSTRKRGRPRTRGK